MTHPLARSWAFAWQAEGRSPRTMVEMQRLLIRFDGWLTANGGELLSATRNDCEGWLASLPTAPLRNYAWRSLRSFYAFAADETERHSPMVKVKAPKVPLTEVSHATEADYEALMRVCASRTDMDDVRDRALISLLWATGLRRSELASLRMQDIDIETMTLVVQFSKTGKSRRVPFDDRTAQYMMRWLAKRPEVNSEALWIGTKGPLTTDGVRLLVERRRRRAGVNVSCHSFRRSLAARALSQGVSGASTSVLLGWAPGSIMLSRYTRMVATQTSIDEYRRAFGKSA